jgi:hypothetical protein
MSRASYNRESYLVLLQNHFPLQLKLKLCNNHKKIPKPVKGTQILFIYLFIHSFNCLLNKTNINLQQTEDTRGALYHAYAVP